MLNSASDSSTLERSASSRSFPRRQSFSAIQERKLNVIASVQRHWAVSLIVFFVILGSGLVILWEEARPVYDAQSVVYISPKFPTVLNNNTEVELPYDSYFQEQIQTVTRHDILEGAIASLPYSARHRHGPALPSELERLQKDLSVKRVGTSYEMSIVLTGPTPLGLAELVNAITNTYIERARNPQFYGVGDRLKTLNQEKQRLQSAIDKSLAEKAHLMEQLGVATTVTQLGTTNPYDATASAVRTELATARMQRETAEAELDASLRRSAGKSNGLDVGGHEAIAADPGLAAMWTELSSHRAALLQEMTGLRPDHPVYQKDKDNLASTETIMNDLKQQAVQEVQNKLRQDVERARMVELKLTRELEEKTNSATSAAPKYLRATQLGPEIDSLQKSLDAIDNRIRDLDLESNSPGSIHVSTRAQTPASPERSKLPIFALAVLMVSLTIATAVPVGMDLLDQRIYTPRDVERVVGFHPIGVLVDEDRFPGEVAGEYYFRLAAGIDHAVRSSGARIFLFTSAAHGAGTSTVVRKLSEQLRSLHLRTRTMTAAASSELDLFSSGDSPQSELPHNKLNRPDDFLHSPPTPNNITDSHSGYQIHRDVPPPNWVEQTLNRAAMEYDVVLIDAQPMPVSAQTEYLARLADATVLVVKVRGTTRQDLECTARLLERLEVAGVAVILNKIRVDRADGALKKALQSYKKSFTEPSVIPKAEPEPKLTTA
jgi:succinoglycan biosynthesis transport protein ExoP